MAWPKGVPRKKATVDVPDERFKGAAVVSEKSVQEVLQTVSAAPRKKVNLIDARSDPFSKFKTDEKRFYYRALNTKPDNLSVREAEGFQVMPEAKFGDLVLAKLPREAHEEQAEEVRDKTFRQTDAAVNQFKEEAARHGVETFDET
jgi:hypothetical protein